MGANVNGVLSSLVDSAIKRLTYLSADAIDGITGVASCGDYVSSDS